MQQNIEVWLRCIKLPVVDRVSPKNIAKIMNENEQLLEEIDEKQRELAKIKEKLRQSENKELAQPILHHILEIERLLIERRTITLQFIEKLYVIRDINAGQDMDDITDSDTLNSVKSIAKDEDRPKGVNIDDETQTSFPLQDDGVVVVTESQFVQTIENKPQTDDFKILRTVESDNDVFEIENMKHQPPVDGAPTTDVIVAAKLKQSEPGSSAKKSELILRNVPTSFETTFVEPDQTTTEVTVDADGNRHILVKKSRVIHHREVIEGEPIEIVTEVEGGDLPADMDTTHTSVIRTVVSQVTRKIIRKTRRIIKKIVIIDGKEHVTEEVVEEPEEIEITEQDPPNVNVNILEYVQSPEDGTYRPICEVPAENIEEQVVIQETQEIVDEPPVQVFESVIAPVDLVQPCAPVVVTATTTTTTTTLLQLAEPGVEEEVKEVETKKMQEDEDKGESEDKTYSIVEEVREEIIDDEKMKTPVEDSVVVVVEEEITAVPIPENIDEIWPDVVPQDDLSASHSKSESVPSAPQSIDENKDSIWPVNENIGFDVELEKYEFEPEKEEEIKPETVENTSDIISKEEVIKPSTLPLAEHNETMEIQTITMHTTQAIDKLSPEDDKASITMTIPSLTSENQESSLNVSVKNQPMVLNLNITEEIIKMSPKTTPETPTKPLPSIKNVLLTEEVLLPSEGVVEKPLERVSDVEPEEEGRKTKRKKKRKDKKRSSDDSTDDQSISKDNDGKEKVGHEKQITPDESYQSFSEYSEADPIKIVEESTIPEMETDLPQMSSQLVHPISIIDSIYVEESEQQTSLPYDGGAPEDGSGRTMKESVEVRSATTSPEPVARADVEQQVPEEPITCQEDEVQTTEVVLTEVESQTTETYQPGEQVEKEVANEEIQTEETHGTSGAKDVTDNISQTVIEITDQFQQTVDEDSQLSVDESLKLAEELVQDIIAHIPTPTATQSSNTDPEPKKTETSVQTVTTTTTETVTVSPGQSALAKPQDIQIEASIVIPSQTLPEFTVEREYVVDEANKVIEDVIPVGKAMIPIQIETLSPKGNKVQISVISKTVVERLYEDGRPTEEHELSSKSLSIDDEQTEQQVALKKDLHHRLQFTKSIATNNKSPINEIAHLAMMDEYSTPMTTEDRVATITSNFDALDAAVERKDEVIIHETVTIILQTISTWLETIEYRVLVNRDSRIITPEGKMSEFNGVRSDLEHVDGFIRKLQTNLDKQPRKDEVDESVRGCVDVVVQQLNLLENIAQESEFEVKSNFLLCSEYQMDVDNLLSRAQSFKTHFDQWLTDDSSLERKFAAIEEYERSNAEMQKEIVQLIERRHQLQIIFPEREVSRQVFTCQEMVNRSAQDITLERNRLDQLVGLAKEYEQTLQEFAKIIVIADTLVQTKIIVNDYESLEMEIQKHRKFFVNLSHCRSILDSLEEHLDPMTRDRHINLHHRLHDSATDILEKASDKAQTLSFAASRWTNLERGMREEKQWLQIVHQRIPDLAAVSSADYDRYITMFQTLATDLAYHHSKWLQLTGVAVKLQELITAPKLEEACNESLFAIFQLKEDVHRDLRKLNKFRQNWTLYEEAANKIENWMAETEVQLDKINIPNFSEQYPLEHLRIFWEVKAQFELHSSIKNDARNNFEQSFQILPVTDEIMQREFWARLHQHWEGVDGRINQIFDKIMSNMSDVNTPDEDKLSILEQELIELNNNLNFTKGVLKNQNDLQLYIERLQILNRRVNIVGTELGQLGLKAYIDSEKVGELFTLSHRISMQISEELDCALLLQDQLNRISMGIIKVRMCQKAVAETMEQCENVERSSSEVVENTLVECERSHEDMAAHWQEIMHLRQLLHTLPQSLKLTVSPVMLERDLSQLQDDHDILAGRCEKLIKLLRHLLVMWRSFEEQLQQAQQSMVQIHYTMELLKVHGQVDYDRLVKATERLEVSVFAFVLFCLSSNYVY